MPFLTIAGIEVLVTDLSERAPEYIGDTGRSYSGAWRGDTSGEIRAWQGTGLEVAASKYHELQSSVRRGVVAVQGAAFHGEGARFMRVALSGDYIRDGAGYLMVPSFTMEDAQVHDLALRYEPGFGGLVHSRADATPIATYIDASGVLRTVAAATDLRDSHYIDAVRHALLEGSRTNGWTFSEQLDNAAWGKTGVTVTANSSTAPDGTTTMDKVVEDTTTGTHRITRVPPALADNSKQAMSLFAEAGGGRNWLAVVTTSKDGTIRTSYLDLANGAAGTTAAGHAIHVSEQLNFGGYRFSLIWPSGSGATSPSVNIYLATGDGGPLSYAGNGTSGAFIWGVQFEANAAAASSYIKTEASTVTRAADVAYIELPQDVATPTAMAVYVNMMERGTVDIPNGYVFHVGSASGSADARFYVRSTGSTYFVAHDAGASASAATLGTGPTVGQQVDIAAVLTEEGRPTLAQSIAGGVATGVEGDAVGLASAWAGTRLYLNSGGTGNFGVMALRNVKIAYRGGLTPVQGTAEEILTYLRHA